MAVAPRAKQQLVLRSSEDVGRILLNPCHGPIPAGILVLSLSVFRLPSVSEAYQRIAVNQRGHLQAPLGVAEH